jgi:RNA polymerase-binding transcription factor DksA
MAKKKDSKKVVKKTTKPAAKTVKSSAKKSAPKTAVSKAAKKVTKTVAKPLKPVKKAEKQKKTAKPIAKKEEKKKMTKPLAKKELKKKEVPAKNKKPAPKETPKSAKKPGKPIDAVAKKGKVKKAVKVKGKKGKATADDEEDDDLPEEEEEDADVEVKDEYEKPEEEETIDPTLDDAGLVDLEGAPAPDLDDDDDEVPEKRGRGRRKKNEGKSSGGSMEAYIRNRPLQIDINRPLIKKGIVAIPKPFVNTDDKRSRYSDKELAEFKALILEKLQEAQMDYDLLKQTLSNEDNHGTDDTSPSFKLLEDGSDVMSKEETAQLASRQEKYIVNLKNALVRIENKSYGICRVTGKLIPKQRLRSVPHATLGIDAKLNQS